MERVTPGLSSRLHGGTSSLKYYTYTIIIMTVIVIAENSDQSYR